ncbi:MAG: NAD-dependent DNA ligase LigA [Fusobacteriaceae bacterium]
MSKKTIEFEEIKKIIEEVEIHNYNYYIKNESLISDVEYDKLVKKIEEFEKKNPEYKEKITITNKIGSEIKDTKFKKVEHKKPMLSLDNSYDTEDIKIFIEKIEKAVNKDLYPFSYDLELKLDGLSISIIYENGKLIQGITRGDGKIGEDVTDNIYMIKSIPKYLKERISMEIRGEIILPLSRFNKINKERLEKGEEVFANPRNAAAGTLRQLDSKIVEERELDAYFYFLIDSNKYKFNGKEIKTHRESLKYIEMLGIKTTGICENLKNISELEKRIEYWNKNKENLDYETDGLVIKVDDIAIWEEIGEKSKSPRWAIAYKFPAKQTTTKLLGITWQVGRTGKVTPVAELEEVNLSGSSVKRASLHNYDEILRKDIRIGDTVFVEKAAEIIPQIVKVVKEVRTGEEIKITKPEFCPSCKSKLVKEEKNVDFKCLNLNCPEKIKSGIEYFVSRNGMNILGFGEKIIDKFIEKGFLNDISDIYKLHFHKEELELIEKMGKKSIEKLLSNIEKSKKNDYEKSLYSLGIPYIGKVVAKILAEHSKDIESLMETAREKFLEIEGIGEKGANAIFEFLNNNKNIEIIKKLQKNGVNFKNKEKQEASKNYKIEFIDKTFLFTGKLNVLSRIKAEEIVKKLGGIISSGINKKLNYLVVGEDAGSKLEKSKKIETIKIMTEEEFLLMISEK